ncbi:MAG: hypothetical protein U7123_26785 [Potamolinea sp.]
MLRIDQQTISLWEQSDLPKERCLKQATRKSIKELKLVHRQGKCYILLSCINQFDDSTEEFIVGNKAFCLSLDEAEWLAFELSIWLKLPIREVEVQIT